MKRIIITILSLITLTSCTIAQKATLDDLNVKNKINLRPVAPYPDDVKSPAKEGDFFYNDITDRYEFRKGSTATVSQMPDTSDVYNRTQSDAKYALVGSVGDGLTEGEVTTIAANVAVDSLANMKAGMYNVLDFGAPDNDTTIDATAFIQAAANAARDNGGILYGRGDFKITSEVIFDKIDVDFTVSRFYINSTSGTAVTWVDSAADVSNKTIIFPEVIQTHAHTNGVWDGASIGIKIVNANTCRIIKPSARFFNTGVLVTSYGAHGSQYNTIQPGYIVSNKVNLRLLPADGDGWVNQNTIIGGRLTHYSNEGTNVTGVFNIVIDSSSSHPVNNNTFIGTSLEGAVAEFDVDCWGAYNAFYNCRWEYAPKVRYSEISASIFSNRNWIQGGLGAEDIVFTESANSYRNQWVPNDKVIMEGSTPFVGSNYASDNNGVFNAVRNSYNKGNTVTSYTGFEAGYVYTKGKASTDTYPRWQFTNTTGILSFGSGAAAVDLNIQRGDVGVINITDPPVYADNAAALSGGLAAGDIYRTSTGVLMIVYTP